jgi:pSer/pThr/pTyr-binding forkhead associated (FHA) protein
MLGKLVPCGGGAPVPLNKPTLVIGRNRDCDIVLGCASVSGRHCELSFRDGDCWVRDLGSKNGTRVNGGKCEDQSVGPNDVLAIGRQRFTLSYPPASRPPPAAGPEPDVDALALEILSADEPAAPPAPAPPAMRTHGPQTYTPHVQHRANLGQLVPCGGGDTIPLLRSEMTVGRHSACDICLRFSSVSGRHCKLSMEQGYWLVQDLGSSNGTWVNGERCIRKCLLPGSVLGLAKHRFKVDYTPTGSSPPPDEDQENVFSQSLLEKAGLAKLMKDPHPPGAQEDEADDDQRRRYRLDLDDN